LSTGIWFFGRKRFKPCGYGLKYKYSMNRKCFKLSSESRHRTLTSPEELGDFIIEFLSDIRGSGSVSDEIEFNIKLTLRELVNNSFLHSGCEAVRILYRRRKNELHYCIMDSGKGFECCGLYACPDMLEESGRGVYLVSCLADELRYNKKGNMVWVKIHI
jgi:anti-sigma regulatory factor (Ser/Thr protein kinase)